MYLKEGKRYADVVWSSVLVEMLEGKEEFVTEMLWNGCVEESQRTFK